jgi:DNA-binding NarL/FixJ family response regulator
MVDHKESERAAQPLGRSDAGAQDCSLPASIRGAHGREPAPSESSPNDALPSGPRASEIHVFLVTADAPCHRAMRERLQGAPVVLEWGSRASELLKRTARLELAAPDLVLLDLEAPDDEEEPSVATVRRRFPRTLLVAFGSELDGERAAYLLGLGVPSLCKPVSPDALAALVLKRWSVRDEPATMPGDPCRVRDALPEPLSSLLEHYAALRGFSERQQLILRRYLDGLNDKEIAQELRCAESTVYEHWRRMAKKARGTQKSCVINDFHRFLASPAFAQG